MYFTNKQQIVNRLVKRAIEEDTQIKEGLDAGEYEDGEIYDEIDAESIWEVATEEIRTYNSTEKKYEDLASFIENEAGIQPRNKQDSVALDFVRGIFGLYVSALLIWCFVEAVRNAGNFAGPDYRLIGINMLLLSAGLISIFYFYWRKNRKTKKAEESLRAWGSKRDVLVEKHGLKVLQEELNARRTVINDLLYQRAKQAVISAINRRILPSYSVTFDIKKPRGFGEVFEKRFTIQTQARKRLEFMLENMPGGSIGIAGSRGAGKTTLLKQFCGPKRVKEQLKGKPLLGVLASAPVAYQARDFILYLFSSICQNVIEAEGGSYAFPPKEEPMATAAKSPSLVNLEPVPALLLRVGVSLILFSLVIAASLASQQLVLSKISTLEAVHVNVAVDQPPATFVSTNGEISKEQTKPSSEVLQKVTTGPDLEGTKHAAAGIAVFLSEFLKLLKIDPAVWITWGISFLVAGLVLAEFLKLEPLRELSKSLKSVMRALFFIIPWYGRFVQRFLDRLSMFNKTPEAPGSLALKEPVDQLSEETLMAEAERWLKTIKFQQSYTSGWSGALKLPVGLETGVTRAVTLAQNQLSLPEIVSLLTRFLEKVSLKYQVVVGIDEMDKLASDEVAQQFLNDIKSIFGLENCFYLISVSENAITNFERRGLPFRDVFDSAFDDFVYVDFLDFNSAKELLEQRVVGRPTPFFALSYCMSGGLARDLIRNFRSILEVYEQNPAENTLTAICKKAVKYDLIAKVRAMKIAATKIKLEHEVNVFLEELHDLELKISNDEELCKAARYLVYVDIERSVADMVADDPVLDKERAVKANELQKLRNEMGTYLYYAVTLRQFFNDEIDESMLRDQSVDGNLNTLAKARQLLGINPSITEMLLNSFRKAHELLPLTLRER